MGSKGTLEDTGSPFGVSKCKSLCRWCCLCLWCCLSWSFKCVLMLVCAVSLSGTKRPAMLVTIEKNHKAATQAFSLRTQALLIVSKHRTAACPRSVIHTRQKCSQFCKIGIVWTLYELCLELVPQKTSKNDISGEHGSWNSTVLL